ncbi:MAG: tRNA pseudouridine(13) synthase TruD [Oceanococcus sp.]
MQVLPYAHGNPALSAKIRTLAEDFIVEETLGFEPSGDGEHVFLTIQKRNTNTVWLAQQLARFAGVKSVAVGYAGLKDRHAVTEQSFTVQMPGQESPDWSALNLPDIKILRQARHNRKLKIGSLQGNRFELVLRDAVGDKAVAERCLQAIASEGVPNYFGEQRFGRDGSNAQRAQAMFEGKRVDRKTRGILISAARSEIFNAVLAARVQDGSWNRGVAGEVWALHGSRSWFTDVDDEVALLQRLRDKDIHPSGPLWGRGELPSKRELEALERSVVAHCSGLADGLERAGLEQDRRSLRLLPSDLGWEWLSDDALRVSFVLPPGCYATVVLRELAQWS